LRHLSKSNQRVSQISIWKNNLPEGLGGGIDSVENASFCFRTSPSRFVKVWAIATQLPLEASIEIPP
jgi:hypothetical protein